MEELELVEHRAAVARGTEERKREEAAMVRKGTGGRASRDRRRREKVDRRGGPATGGAWVVSDTRRQAERYDALWGG